MVRFKKFLAVLLFPGLSGSFSGCGLNQKYIGPASYKPLSSPKSSVGPYSLAVLVPEDKRGRRNDTGAKLDIVNIPLVPYASMIREKPELPQPELRARLYRDKRDKYVKFAAGFPPDFSVPLFLQENLVKELQHSGIFQRVYAARSPAELGQADLVLKPMLLSSKLTSWYSQYGLGFLWWDPGLMFFLPFPMGGVTQELMIRLELYQPGEPKALWTGQLHETGKGKGHLYYLSGFSKYYGASGVAAYPNALVMAPSPGDHGGQPLNDLLAQGMQKSTPALHDFLKKQPPSFWEELEARRASRPQEYAPAPSGEEPSRKPGSSIEDLMKQLQKELQEE